MTPKQQRFADEYLIDLNATRAYRATYPRIKNDEAASAAGARLLRNVNIKSYIAAALEEMHNSKIADATEVMKYLTSVLRGESTSEIVVVETIGVGVSKAKHVEKAPDEKEKLKAAELLGKRYRMFTDNIMLDGVIPVIIRDDLGDDDG